MRDNARICGTNEVSWRAIIREWEDWFEHRLGGVLLRETLPGGRQAEGWREVDSARC